MKNVLQEELLEMRAWRISTADPSRLRWARCWRGAEVCLVLGLGALVLSGVAERVLGNFQLVLMMVVLVGIFRWRFVLERWLEERWLFNAVWFVLGRDAGGMLQLEKQWRWGQRVVRRESLVLADFSWVRVGTPDAGPVPRTLALQLGNAGYQTQVLAAIVARHGRMSALESAQARAELLALSAQIAALTGLTDRGYTEMY